MCSTRAAPGIVTADRVTSTVYWYLLSAELKCEMASGKGDEGSQAVTRARGFAARCKTDGIRDRYVALEWILRLRNLYASYRSVHSVPFIPDLPRSRYPPLSVCSSSSRLASDGFARPAVLSVSLRLLLCGVAVSVLCQ